MPLEGIREPRGIDMTSNRRFAPRVAVTSIALLSLTTLAASCGRADARGAGKGEASRVRTDSIDWKAVDAAMGRAAVVQPGDVHRFNFPRGDLQVTAAGVSVKPALALGGWIAMKAVTGGA